MLFERLAEMRIRDAIQEGRFDDLPGRGRPIDLEDYFRAPEHLRLAHSILRSAGCVPEEVELMNEIAALDAELAGLSEEAARARVSRARAARRLRLALCLERARRT